MEINERKSIFFYGIFWGEMVAVSLICLARSLQ